MDKLRGVETCLDDRRKRAMKIQASRRRFGYLRLVSEDGGGVLSAALIYLLHHPHNKTEFFFFDHRQIR